MLSSGVEGKRAVKSADGVFVRFHGDPWNQQWVPPDPVVLSKSSGSGGVHTWIQTETEKPHKDPTRLTGRVHRTVDRTENNWLCPAMYSVSGSRGHKLKKIYLCCSGWSLFFKVPKVVVLMKSKFGQDLLLLGGLISKGIAIQIRRHNYDVKSNKPTSLQAKHSWWIFFLYTQDIINKS